MMHRYTSIVSDILLETPIATCGQSEPNDELASVKDSLAHLRGQLQNTNNSTLVSLFVKTTQALPEKIAVEGDAGSITFSELSKRSDAVSDFLVQADICTGQVVPIIFGHSIDMIIAMLGIMKAGAAYCPIDVESPERRIRHVVEKVAARVIIGDSDYREKLSDIFLAEIGFVCIEEIEHARMTSGTKAAVRPPVAPQNPCYILFTSGSTGPPKGCVLSHSAVVNAVLQTSSTTQIDESSRVLLFANYTFDASVIDIFGCLVTGGTLCLSPRARLLSNLQLVIHRRQISHVHLTPSVAQVLSPDACPSLKTLVLGGEPMSPTLRDRWAGRVKLYDGYGPTECAVQVSTTLVNLLSDVGVLSNPLPGNIILLLDRQGEISRAGEIGEICIGGHQVFSRYLSEPEATEKALRRSPAIASPLFATGDFGRYRQDMTIELLGRKDTQVKLSGERVEVGEIESVICSFEAVKRCAVLVERNQLYAVVEERGGTSGTTSDHIREWCLGRLPERLVPLVLLWPSVPLTISNKLDRRAIVQKFREVERPGVVAVENTLSSETEHSIASMIAKISGHRPKDAILPLHHSGLNSLDILHLRSSMARHFGFALGLPRFWLAGSIRSLANLVEENIVSPEESRKEVASIASDFLPASNSQLAIWMAQKRYSDSAYNVGRVLHFRDVDSHRMYASLRAVVESFDIFRITFEWHYAMESLQQRLHPESNVFMELHELGDCGDDVAAVRTVCGVDYKTVFDLENGPLARFRVFASDGRDCYLYYNIHHVIIDEWTCEKFVDAVLKEYRGFPWGNTMDPSWDSPTTIWEYESRKDIALADWKLKLSGVTTFDTYSWPRGSADMGIRGSVSTSVFKASIEVLQKLRLELSGGPLSLFIALLSAFQVLLHQYTTSRNLVVLIPVSRRGFDVRSINTIGNMTHTAAVRSDIEPGDTFVTFGKRTAKSVSFARENSFVPIDKTLNTISSAVSDHSVMFVYSQASASHGPTEFSDLTRNVLPQTFTMFDITLNVIEEAGGLSISVTFNTNKFAFDFMERLAESYLLFVTQMTREGTEKTLRHLLSLSQTGLQDIEASTDVLKSESQISSTLLNEAFEARAIEAPLSVAIDFLANGQRTVVSYAELNNKANKLAAMLQDKYGIVSGDIVPVFVDQTPELLVAVIGILKAGAGYTPIPRDGSWPLENICQILRRCRAKVLISDTNVLPGVGVTVLNVHSPLAYSNRVATCLATPDCTAYILWTSGTTGEPKGVMISHSAATSCISNISGRLYPRSTKDRVFQFSSPVFDVSVVDYFATLSIGATLCMMPRAELLSDLQKAVSELKPTAASLTPSVALLLNPTAAKFETLIVSGEVVTPKIRDMFVGVGTNLINGYGPTESNIVTFTEMNAVDDIRSIGKPFASARVTIIDAFGNVASTFVRGEICIGGPHLFSGYQSRKDLTKRAHVIDEKYGRLYKTGDVGFFDATGNIIFCGRRDTQAKLNGQRLEPEAISSVISEMAHIESNAVAIVEERLVAFVVYGTFGDQTAATTSVVPHKQKDMNEIRNHVRGRVPSALVPSIWLRISRVPLTISGKIDMRKLASLVEATAADQGGAYHGPEDQYEEKIHDCCLQILGASISVTANLLDHGLDSYLAMVLISRLRVAFPNFQLSFRGLMANPVPRRLAVLARHNSTTDNDSDFYTPKVPADVSGSL